MPLTIQLRFQAETDAPASIPQGALAQAAARAVQNCLVQHFRDRNSGGAKRSARLAKSDYWADAADSIRTETGEAGATVTIDKEGVALHRFGGVVTPTRGKALAIPLRAEVQGRNPRELAQADPSVVYVPGRTLGRAFLARRERSGHLTLLWQLVRRTTHRPDPSALPDDDAVREAGADAVADALDAFAAQGAAP